MNLPDRSVRAVPLPEASRATRFYPRTDLADAYAVGLPDGAIDDPEQLARFILAQQPPWIGALLKLRDGLVAGFGLKTVGQLRQATPASGERRIDFFRIFETHPHEILIGEDDSHLDFRLSVMTQPAPGAQGRQIVLSTVVHCHNTLGRAYIALIAPFHRRIVQASLARAARTGWPLRERPAA